MSLEIYYECGFKLFPCLVDKKPDVPYNESWKDDKWHIDIEKAESLQNTGTMIGAWIPDDMIVIDLDRHPGDPDGVESFKKIKDDLDLSINFIDDTTVIKTAGGGFHLLFYVGKNHNIKQGEIKINKEKTGIDIKTNSGYVIASGSPGYETICDFEPAELPERLKDFIIDNRGKPAEKKEIKEESETKSKLLPPKLLKSILTKIKVENFRSNDRWMEFMMSAIATSGTSEKVVSILEEWSTSDSEYSADRSISNRIESFTKDGGISVGSFIMYLREENLSPYMINQVIKLDSITAAIMDGEQNESELPFEEPNYHELAETKYMKEFFHTCGNSAAKNILYEAFNGNIMHVKGEKETYYFNGSRWKILTDYYSVVYTILFRVSKIYYAKCDEGKENQDRLMKIVNAINDTTWKSKTITEANAKIRVDGVNWDSPAIKETITTKDGVIDFSKKSIEKRIGYRGEFRLKYIEYTCDEILNARPPENFNTFMSEIFPDPGTLKMAYQLVSLCISGNADKRIFQLWEGDGFNGKSTLIDIIKKVLEGKTNTYNPQLLMPDFYGKSGVTPELVTFRGSYAAVGVEVEQGKEFSMGIIKNLTGGDTITANPKHKAQIEFDPTWQLILAVNDLPKFNALDGAFIDRLFILPFEMTYPRNDDDIKELLRKGIPKDKIGKRKNKTKLLASIFEEKAGIIRTMITDYIDVQNFHDGRILESDESKGKKSFYIQDNDDFGDFIENMCIVEREGFCSSEEIIEAFKDYMGFKKASSKWVISNIKKYNRMITSTSREVMISGEFNSIEKKRRRGLSGIRVKTKQELFEKTS